MTESEAGRGEMSLDEVIKEGHAGEVTFSSALTPEKQARTSQGAERVNAKSAGGNKTKETCLGELTILCASS